MDVNLLFFSKDVVQKIIEYQGMVETVDKKIEKLGQAKLDSGIKAFEQAKKAPKEEVPWLIREARSKFNEATTIEKNERLGLAYLGLALCFSYLEDEANCLDALEKILKVPSSKEDSFIEKAKEHTKLTTKLAFALFMMDPRPHDILLRPEELPSLEELTSFERFKLELEETLPKR